MFQVLPSPFPRYAQSRTALLASLLASLPVSVLASLLSGPVSALIPSLDFPVCVLSVGGPTGCGTNSVTAAHAIFDGQGAAGGDRGWLGLHHRQVGDLDPAVCSDPPPVPHRRRF